MPTPGYDIFKIEGLSVVWIEAICDVDAARVRIEELARRAAGEYVIFDQRRRQMIANTTSSMSKCQTPAD